MIPKQFPLTGLKTLHLLTLLFIAVLLLNGCGGKFYTDHSALQGITPDTPVATVYFIRPALLKPKGFADRAITVDYLGEPLLTIEQGYYTLFKIKPGKGDVVTHSLTKFTSQLEPIEVSRKRTYNFIAGKTYFIYLKQLNEEFRGVFYDPMPVSLDEAKKLIVEADPRGAARDARIEDIESVPDAPEPSKIEPAFPEKLYPQQPYLLKKPIEQ